MSILLIIYMVFGDGSLVKDETHLPGATVEQCLTEAAPKRRDELKVQYPNAEGALTFCIQEEGNGKT